MYKTFKKSELLEALQITLYDLKDPKNLSEKYALNSKYIIIRQI